MLSVVGAAQGGRHAARATMRLVATANSLARSSRRHVSSGCCVPEYYVSGGPECDTAFSVRSNNFKYGHGVLDEVGADAKWLIAYMGHIAPHPDSKRVAVITDKTVRKLKAMDDVTQSLVKAGLEPVVYDEVHVEPSSKTFMHAARFVRDEGPFAAVVSFGGGSSMDTAKAAILYACHPPPEQPGVDPFLHYVNAPVGLAKPVPPTGLIPHIAVPTTAGTGSEATGFAICKLEGHPTAPRSKTGIASASLIPNLAIVEPSMTHTLPHNVIAASGFDVLCHGIESYTARPYTRKPRSNPKNIRPLNQGANPYSDFACEIALRMCGRYFERALTDPNDFEAREHMMWASTIVGSAMGNAGVHLPHGLSYPVAGQVKEYRPDSGYPKDEPLIPHGMGVIMCAPGVFRHTGKAYPHRHFEAAKFMELDLKTAKVDDSGEILYAELSRLAKVAGFPNGLRALGFNADDLGSLVKSCWEQKRVVDNAPCVVTPEDIESMYKDCMKLW